MDEIIQNYLEYLRKANTLEVKNPKEALSMLNIMHEHMDANQAEFLTKFPDRKNDFKNIEARIGKVKKKLDDYEKNKILALIKAGDTKCNDFKFSEAANEYKKALNQAELGRFEDIRQQAQQKLDELAQKEKEYNEKNQELSQLMLAVKKKQNISIEDPTLLEDYDKIIILGTQLKREGIIKDYTAAKERLTKKVAALKVLKVDINQLRQDALRTLEKGELGHSMEDFSQIVDKIDTYRNI